MSRDRWKILTSHCKRCDVADGIDLAEAAYKSRTHSVCNVGSLCTCQATAFSTRRQCCGLDDEGIIHQFMAVKSFLSSSEHSNKLQGQPSHAVCSICTRGKAAGSGRKPLISCLVAVLRTWSFVRCTFTPLVRPTVWCLVKHRDNCTFYEVLSC